MLDHIEIYVSNLEETRCFYDFLLPRLNWNLYQVWQHGFSYRFDSYYLVFVQTTEAFVKHGYHRKNVGLNHLAFQLDSTDSVDLLRQSLLNYGVTELYPENYPHAGGNDTYAFYFEGPDRVKLEIVHRKMDHIL